MTKHNAATKGSKNFTLIASLGTKGYAAKETNV